MNLLVSVLLYQKRQNWFQWKPLLAAFAIVVGPNRAKSNQLALSQYSMIKSSRDSNCILLYHHKTEVDIDEIGELTIIFKNLQGYILL
jgi:hypothetical protein